MRSDTRRQSNTTSRAPNVIVLGYGSPDALHLTLEAERIVERIGRAFTIGSPPLLERRMKQLRVKLTDLASYLGNGRPHAEAYVDIVEEVLARTALERPVVLLTPGNPMFLNSVSRFLVLEARRQGLGVNVHAGVSALDVLVSYVGVDVGSLGLQVHTAASFVSKRVGLNPRVPLFLMELAGLGTAAGNDGYRTLAHGLRHFYPPAHPVTMVNLTATPGRRAHATRPLSGFAEFLPHVAVNSHLFVDAARAASPNQE